MPDERSTLPFEPRGSKRGEGLKSSTTAPSSSTRQEAIPRYVADRMARRVAVFTGLPTVAGMGVFVGSYLLITQGIADIAPGITLAGSGFFFLLGLVGLSFGVLSSSWEQQPGSLLGLENLKPNLQRMRQSIRAQKQQKKQS
ncbi:MAG: PAM68 family protein [Cyanobacteriota bacterium]|nr:PAM68 family protein [Cyanobacteriota bacterium]